MSAYSDLQLNKIAIIVKEKFPDSFCFSTDTSGITIKAGTTEIALIRYHPESDNLVFTLKKAMGEPEHGTKENFEKIIELKNLINQKFVAKKFSRKGKIRKFTFSNPYNY